jgi:inorganic pyrophosphatase
MPGFSFPGGKDKIIQDTDEKGEQNMNPWKDVDEDRIKPEDFVTYIEISKGGHNKYELDKKTGLLKLDRILYTATHYPQNYGFIPRTLADDGDPLDVLLIMSEPVVSGCLVEARPIGMIDMYDQGKRDCKILAICPQDPFYNNIYDISQLPSHLGDEIQHFFEVYKSLEGKSTQVPAPQGREAAVKVITENIEDFKKAYPKQK